MAYSLDLRKRVVDYVENGGGITKAAALFKVGRATIYRWLRREDLRATKVEHRERKISLFCHSKQSIIEQNLSNLSWVYG